MPKFRSAPRSAPRTLRRLGMRAVAVGGALGIAGLAAATPAFAAGTGYGPAVNPTAPSGGGFSTVVLSKTVPTSGGSFSASSGGNTYSFKVTPGTFGVPVQVSVDAPTDISAVHGVAGVAVNFYSPNGIPLPPEKLTKPIVVTISSPSIKSGDQVEIFSGGHFVAYTGPAQVSNGSAAISLTSDPVFAVVPGPAKAVATSTTPPATSTATPATSTVSGATTAHTGKPFFAEELGAATAALLGAGGVVEILRRRRRAA